MLLVITIIVLLILAGVTIVTLTGDNGILQKAGEAKNKMTDAEIVEKIKLAYKDFYVAQKTNNDIDYKFQDAIDNVFGIGVATVTGNDTDEYIVTYNERNYIISSTGTVTKVKTISEYPEAIPGTVNNDENTKYTSNGKIAVIPVGYTVSNETTEQSIDNGLVITKDSNEWVWIPVADATDLYDINTTDTEWILCGTSGDNKVVSLYASKIKYISYDEGSRVAPGSAEGCKEPDTMIGESGTQYDAVEANYTAAGYTSFLNMAISLRDDYKNMIDSIIKYGGFYVGRYELGGSVATPKVQKGETVLANTNWYNLYKACNEFEDRNVYSRMIWGCQWEQICKFINIYGDKVNIENSRSYGNYRDSSGRANVTGKGGIASNRI